jgi:hypothetical protein
MTTSGVVSEEHSLPTEQRPSHAEMTDARWRFTIDGMIEGKLQQMWVKVRQFMETRRRQDGTRGPDPDYAPPVTMADLERIVKQIAHDHEPGIEIHNSKGSPSPTGTPPWQNKILVGVAITVISTAILEAIATVIVVGSIRTKIEDYIKSNDQRLGRDETLIDATQRRLDRGASPP